MLLYEGVRMLTCKKMKSILIYRQKFIDESQSDPEGTQKLAISLKETIG